MLRLQVEAAACVHTNAPSICSHPCDPSIPRLEGRAAAAAAPAQAGVILPAILTPGPHARPAAVSSPQRRPAGPALPTTPAVGPLYSRDSRDCADCGATSACSDCACLPIVPDKPRPSFCSGPVVGPLIKAPIHCNDAAAPLYLFPIPATGGAAIVTFQISCQSHMISPVES